MIFWILFSLVVFLGAFCISNAERDFEDISTASIVVCSTLFVVSVFLGYYVFYIVSFKDIAKLETECTSNIANVKYICEKLNEKCVVKNQGDKLIIDVANLQQSSKTSDLYKDFLDKTQDLNRQIAVEKAVRQKGIGFRIMYGWLCPLPETIKPINISQ